MIKGVGVDVVEISRFQHEKNLDDFLSQILSQRELAALPNNSKRPKTASRIFAIKEAILKALGCGLHMGSYWRDIELAEDNTPQLCGFLRRLAEEKSISRIHVSHSFSDLFSAAMVVLED